jgi:hypothetical protein
MEDVVIFFHFFIYSTCRLLKNFYLIIYYSVQILKNVRIFLELKLPSIMNSTSEF